MSPLNPNERPYASRSGQKLAAALDAFGIDPCGFVCADLGCNVGGFTDCLLRRGADKVYAIDTGYGTLAYRLRKDPHVVVMERTNAMHVMLPEAVDLVTIDVAWTRQHNILPNAMKLLKAGGLVVTLIKPHYEADKDQTKRGVLDSRAANEVMEGTCERIGKTGFQVEQVIESPIVGGKGNIEYLALLRQRADGH